MDKEKTTEINNMDEELKALAKAFINTAIRKGVKQTDAHVMVRMLWRECNREITPKQVVIEVLEETEEEKTFREKLKKLIKVYPRLNKCRYRLVNEKTGEETNATIEMLCAMNSLFESGKVLTSASTEGLTKQRLEYLMQNGTNKYPISTEIKTAAWGTKEFVEKIAKEEHENGLNDFLKNHKATAHSILRKYLVVKWLIEKEENIHEKRTTD